MAPVAPASEEGAELLRQEGNFYFSKGRIAAAIEAYTQGITLRPDMVVLWTNRALCYWKQNEWTRVEEDCRRAIQLDHNSFKGHYMLGLALLQKEDYDAGVRELDKAMDLVRGADSKGYMVEEIWKSLARAKYLAWARESTQRAFKIKTLKEDCERALVDKHPGGISPEMEGESDASAELEEQIQLLSEVFSKAVKADTPSEVPDYLCCKITLAIFRDPVITPSGVTYERAVLLEHLEKVGNFDPVTRLPLNKHHLVPNLAIKEAVQSFLNEHGWAYKMS